MEMGTDMLQFRNGNGKECDLKTRQTLAQTSTLRCVVVCTVQPTDKASKGEVQRDSQTIYVCVCVTERPSYCVF